MICTKMLAFPARDAAARLAPPRRSGKRKRSRWQPIGLRWRRVFKRQPAIRAERSARSAVFLCQPQFHFHLAAFRSESKHHDRLVSAGLAERVRQTTQSHYYDRLTNTRHFGPLRIELRSRHTEVPGHRGPARYSGITSLASATPTWRTPILLGSCLRRISLLERITERVHAAANIEQANKPFTVAARNVCLQWGRREVMRPVDNGAHRGSQAERRRGRIELLQELVLRPKWRPARLASRQVDQQQYRSLIDPRRIREIPRVRRPQTDSEELIWRRRQSPAAEMAGERQQERNWSHSSILPSPAHEVAVAAPQVVERARPQLPVRLDPAVLDRLTDDVIRRVEQRMRIERQRRGL